MIFEYFIVLLLGLAFGSFSNVLINRLPSNKNIITPSCCPHCLTNIKYYDNIPIISYLFLRGHSRCCNKQISLQYPVIEAVVAILALLVFRYSELSLNTVMIFLLMMVLIIIFMTDFKEYIIPNSITYPMALIGLCLSIAQLNPFGTFQIDSLMGGIISGVLFFSLSKLFLILKKKEGLGMGDVKMISMLGFWLGLELIIMIIVLSSILGIIVGITLILIKKIEASQYLPYGCFISAAALIAIYLRLIFNFSYINFFLL